MGAGGFESSLHWWTQYVSGDITSSSQADSWKQNKYDDGQTANLLLLHINLDTDDL